MLARLAWGTLYAKAGLLILLLVVGLVLYARLSIGPLSLDALGGRVGAALAERMGPGWSVKLRDTALVLEDGALGLQASGLDVHNPDGALVVRAPFALVSVETLPLLTASLQPRSIELRDLQLRAAINRDGSLSFLAPGEGAPDGSPSEASAPFRTTPPRQEADEGQPEGGQPAGRPSPLSAALSSLFELIVEPTNVVGALDRARVINARLTLIDAEQRERVAFNRVEANFSHSALRTRQFEMTLNGAYGAWRIGGEVHRGRGGRRDGTIFVSEVPIHDLLLLSGLSGLPGTSDLKVSGRAEASLTRGTLERFETQLVTGGGTVEIDDKDTSPMRVDSMSASASWDEARRNLALDDVRFRSGETDLKLRGNLTTAAGEPGWRLALNGKEALIGGETLADPPFRVDAVEASLGSNGGPIHVDRLSLQGEKFSVNVEGSYGSSEAEGLRVQVAAKEIDVRSALRLWPEGVASAVRRFLVPNLLGGIVENVNIGVALTPTELSTAIAGGPAPEKAVKVDFALRDAELAVTEGLPPVSRAQVQGRITGTTAAIKIPSARVEMPDGRALMATEGSFAMADLRPKMGPAQIAFRLTGGADAVGSLLQEPIMRRIAGIEIDPSGMKGQADVRVNLPLTLSDIPDLSDLPITVSGGLSDLTIDKAFGREKLEGANVNIAYARGSLNLRGEGKLSGTPAVVEVRQPRGVPGELAVLLTLDEAARARRGLSVGSQLAGPIAVRIALPLSKANRGAGPRVEIDLAKAVIDNLVPGWTKPAGKPGRVTFVLGDGTGTDVQDLVIESGSVQIRGAATFTADGTLEKADLPTLKLSPGDDMRAQIERAGGVYRVNLRGNVLDARPFVKALSAPPAPAAAASGSREGRDIDLDLSANIITGHNDETLTNGSLKLSTRNRDLKQLQLTGRLRAAQVSAQLNRRERSPVILVQSDDAGATLRFVDLYRRMVGGQLVLQVTSGDAPQAGNVSIDGFSLRNEPALRRIIPQQPGAATSDDRGDARVAINSTEVEFTKLHADFVRTASRVEFRDATMWGMNVGFTIGGWIDYGRDRADISGTFVPAYGLNNIFSQVPVFGLILGGGQNEGLFAVNFRISGLASSPTLTVNPLSAVAPGFLRKFFGVGGSLPDATATIPPRPDR